jgi:hypothetical protein
VEIEPLGGRVPLQPPEALQFCAPLAFQLKVTGSPEFTVLGLNCKEIDGLASVRVAALASPLPPCVRESPSQAAKDDKDEITAHAKSERKALATIRRRCTAQPQRELESVGTLETCVNRWLRPAELIPTS